MRWEYFFVFGNAALSSASLLLIRHGGKNLELSQGLNHILTHGRIWFLGVALGWVCGLLFAFLLTRINLTVAFSLHIPLLYTLTFLGGALFLKESVDIYKMLGSVVIVLGLCIFFKSGSLS